MSDLTIKELSEMLKKLPIDARVSYHSGENGGLLVVTAKNGKRWWNILKDGSFTEHKG